MSSLWIVNVCLGTPCISSEHVLEDVGNNKYKQTMNESMGRESPVTNKLQYAGSETPSPASRLCARAQHARKQACHLGKILPLSHTLSPSTNTTTISLLTTYRYRTIALQGSSRAALLTILVHFRPPLSLWRYAAGSTTRLSEH